MVSRSASDVHASRSYPPPARIGDRMASATYNRHYNAGLEARIGGPWGTTGSGVIRNGPSFTGSYGARFQGAYNFPVFGSLGSCGSFGGVSSYGGRRGKYSGCVGGGQIYNQSIGPCFNFPQLSFPVMPAVSFPMYDLNSFFNSLYSAPAGPPERARPNKPRYTIVKKIETPCEAKPEVKPADEAKARPECPKDPWPSDKSERITYAELVKELDLKSNDYLSKNGTLVDEAAPSFDYLGLSHDTYNETFAGTDSKPGYYDRFKELYKDRFKKDIPIDRDTFIAMADTIDKYFPDAKGAANSDMKLKIFSHLFRESRFEFDPTEPICTERGIGQFTYDTAKNDKWKTELDGESVSASLRTKKLNNPTEDGMAFDLAFSLQYLRHLYNDSAKKDIDRSIRAYNTGSPSIRRGRSDTHLAETTKIFNEVKAT